ncbi:MAG: metallophosphoesterase [Candidatus Thiodiazotropha sp.]|jgi:predicted phosphodiesterase
MRIFTVSDIHTNYQENNRWVNSLSNFDFTDDCLLLAGDISDSVECIDRCFLQLTKKFRKLFYVPGNHELWVHNNAQENSVERFQKLLDLAQEYGVITQQKSFGTTTIIPLFSWYDLKFGALKDTLRNRWMDFSNCKWPEGLDNNPEAQNSYFLQKNKIEHIPSSRHVITFSHFLPRIDVMPNYIPHRFRDIYPVLGSPLLDQQIRSLQSKIHIYGHSHVNHKTVIDGIQYINNAFGYPSEARITAKSLLEVAEIL